MNINSAKFTISNTDVNKCPQEPRHEYAFIGRSNVGKSSLINMLTSHKKLAMTSATPGKTTLINHFLINDQWYIVDLPGYGYAQRGKQMQKQIRDIIESYILNRWQMTNLFLLIDCRLAPQKIDLEFTKLDKLSAAAGKKQIEKYMAILQESWEELPPVFRTSSADGRGRAELLDYIEELNKLPLQCDNEE